MNAHPLDSGIRSAARRARLALDPGLAEREMRAVALNAAMTAQALAEALRRFDGDPEGVARQRRRVDLLAAELGALAGLCGGTGRRAD